MHGARDVVELLSTAVETLGTIQGCLPAALGQAAALHVVSAVVQRRRPSASDTGKGGHRTVPMDRKDEQGRAVRETRWDRMKGDHNENTHMVRPTIASPMFSDICWEEMNDERLRRCSYVN